MISGRDRHPYGFGERMLVLGAIVIGSISQMASNAVADEVIKKPVKSVKAVKPVSASRAELKTNANQIATGVRAAEAALSPEELAIAQRVEVGQVACELGVSVSVKADAKLPGYFDVQSRQYKFRMAPVVTSTGAIRLEDAHAGAVWLQLSNKSMLMSQKTGSRLADVCMTPGQLAVAQAIEKNPPVSLLDPVRVSKQPVAGPVKPVDAPSVEPK